MTKTQNMKAVRMHHYGGADVLRFENAPRPEPGDGELLIRVHAAAVHPVDWKIREGNLTARLAYPLPFIPGWDVSGTVAAAGPGVTKFQKGNEVFSRPDIARNGAYAEYIVVRESEVALKPKSVDDLHAAAIPLAALTAWQGLFEIGGLRAGQRILIHGASGGVGNFAVQLAKWTGAHVIGTASRRNQSFLRELGVDEPIDYEKTRFEDVVHEVDVVFDTIGGEVQQRSLRVLRQWTNGSGPRPSVVGLGSGATLSDPSSTGPNACGSGWQSCAKRNHPGVTTTDTPSNQGTLWY